MTIVLQLISIHLYTINYSLCNNINNKLPNDIKVHKKNKKQKNTFYNMHKSRLWLADMDLFISFSRFRCSDPELYRA